MLEEPQVRFSYVPLPKSSKSYLPEDWLDNSTNMSWSFYSLPGSSSVRLFISPFISTDPFASFAPSVQFVEIPIPL
jgi:hypothetical protein